ncbi:MAG: hypothetical protein V1746_04205 [bacterium]
MIFFKKDAISLEQSRLEKGRADLQKQSLELESSLQQHFEDVKRPKLKLALGEKEPADDSFTEKAPLKIQKRRARNHFIILCVILIILLILISKIIF